MRTYQPLKRSRYYSPSGIYKVYYSKEYGKKYYDGYGWNFYTQEGSYYDMAPQKIERVFLILICLFTNVCTISTFTYLCMNRRKLKIFKDYYLVKVEFEQNDD